MPDEVLGAPFYTLTEEAWIENLEEKILPV